MGGKAQSSLARIFATTSAKEIAGDARQENASISHAPLLHRGEKREKELESYQFCKTCIALYVAPGASETSGQEFAKHGINNEIEATRLERLER